ncbi:hypothetical protein [Streptomyces sp. SID3343]|uniref:hypothetical protein n=1 Tax=Streptomyces sp. SID3343 TaxID=2690260 RepID=UPI001F2A0E1B|nr:hypothetical protein [Streptomyces sp. SID3343]
MRDELRDEYLRDGSWAESQDDVRRTRRSEPPPAARAEPASGERLALAPGSRVGSRGNRSRSRKTSDRRFTRPVLVAVPIVLVIGAGLAYWVNREVSSSSDGGRAYPKCPVSSGLSTVEREYGVSLPKEGEQVRYCGDRIGTPGGAVFEFTASTAAVGAYLTSIGINPTEMRSTPFVYRFRTDDWPLSTGQAYLTATTPWQQFKACPTTLRVILAEPVDERQTAYLQVTCAN